MSKSTVGANKMKEAIKNSRTVYVNNKMVRDNWLDSEEIDLLNIEFISWEKKKKTLHLRTKLEKA